jgi:hypothetical protein
MTGDEALPIVRELGVANIAIGVVGLLSLAAPSFRLPTAIAAAMASRASGAPWSDRARSEPSRWGKFEMK